MAMKISVLHHFVVAFPFSYLASIIVIELCLPKPRRKHHLEPTSS